MAALHQDLNATAIVRKPASRAQHALRRACPADTDDAGRRASGASQTMTHFDAAMAVVSPSLGAADWPLQ